MKTILTVFLILVFCLTPVFAEEKECKPSVQESISYQGMLDPYDVLLSEEWVANDSSGFLDNGCIIIFCENKNHQIRFCAVIATMQGVAIMITYPIGNEIYYTDNLNFDTLCFMEYVNNAEENAMIQAAFSDAFGWKNKKSI